MLAALTALVLTVAAPVQVLEDAATSLRSDPVFVDPSAERAISDAEADALREQIAEEGVAVFIDRKSVV